VWLKSKILSIIKYGNNGKILIIIINTENKSWHKKTTVKKISLSDSMGTKS